MDAQIEKLTDALVAAQQTAAAAQALHAGTTQQQITTTQNTQEKKSSTILRIQAGESISTKTNDKNPTRCELVGFSIPFLGWLMP